ncbi:hypothetical protein KY339_05530 [Candidatus Woesearchaeota archaeon]|nr:hypothetical protein [Candidatus Woesearchaeota archaeon]
MSLTRNIAAAFIAMYLGIAGCAGVKPKKVEPVREPEKPQVKPLKEVQDIAERVKLNPSTLYDNETSTHYLHLIFDNSMFLVTYKDGNRNGLVDNGDSLGVDFSGEPSNELVALLADTYDVKFSDKGLNGIVEWEDDAKIGDGYLCLKSKEGNTLMICWDKSKELFPPPVVGEVYFSLIEKVREAIGALEEKQKLKNKLHDMEDEMQNLKSAMLKY